MATLVCIRISNSSFRSAMKMDMTNKDLNAFLSSLADVHKSNLFGLEAFKNKVKATCEDLELQGKELKKPGRRAGRYKPALPSLNEIPEEKNNRGSNAPRRAAAVKSELYSNVMLNNLKPKKKRKSRKRKLQSSSQANELESEEDEVVPAKDNIEAGPSSSASSCNNMANPSSGSSQSKIKASNTKQSAAINGNTFVKPDEEAVEDNRVSPEFKTESSQNNKTVVKPSGNKEPEEIISLLTPETRKSSLRKNVTNLPLSKSDNKDQPAEVERHPIEEKEPQGSSPPVKLYSTSRISKKDKTSSDTTIISAPAAASSPQERSSPEKPSSASSESKEDKVTPEAAVVSAPAAASSPQDSSSPEKPSSASSGSKEDKITSEAAVVSNSDSSEDSASPQKPNFSSKIPKKKITKLESDSDKDRPTERVTELRVTRSKAPKPKKNQESSMRPESASSEVFSSPEKRSTRSKMNKRKLNEDVENKNLVSSLDDFSSPEKRCTRSKMAKTKPKQNEASTESDDSFEAKSDSPATQDLRTHTAPKAKMKSILERYTPAFKKGQEKENQVSSAVKTIEKKILGKNTPLQIRNAYVTPTAKSAFKIPIPSNSVKSKIEEVERRKKEEEARRNRLKEEEAIRKKLEMVKAKQEDVRRKNEEKMLKAAATREAAEKEKSEHLLKVEKEKEEREKLVKELLERKKEEEVIKKKKAHQTKALEAETRRLKEEAARLARLKEMEEEEKRQEELRIKQQEEMERIQKQRQEELRIKEAAMKAREQQKKKANLIPLKDKDNLDINDFETEDDEDDDYSASTSKRELPLWAQKSEEKDRQDRVQAMVPMDVVRDYYACPSQTPDLTELFGKMTMKRVRSSSAVWLDTPPLQFKK